MFFLNIHYLLDIIELLWVIECSLIEALVVSLSSVGPISSDDSTL